MIIPIVNGNDEIIGSKDRADLDYEKDIFRTASLWITNKNGDVLLAQRSFNKKVDPGKWAEAVGGTVDGDDSYEETVLREAEEELGLKDIQVHIGPKQFIDSSAKYFVQWYTAEVNKPAEEFVIQLDEVDQVVWISPGQLKKELSESPDKYIPSMREISRLFI